MRVVVRDDDAAAGERWCRRCGCTGAPRGNVLRRLAHIPLEARPTTLLATVARYGCTGCPHVWRQDITAAAQPHAKLTRAALTWAVRALVVQHFTVSRVLSGYPKASPAAASGTSP